MTKVIKSAKVLTLSASSSEVFDGNSRDEWEFFAKKFSADIIDFCSITPDTEHQLDNFGPGSAWLYESPHHLGIHYAGDHEVQVTITR